MFRGDRRAARVLGNPLLIVLVGIAFRIVLIPFVLHWMGTPRDHFEGNEPSHIAAHILRGEGFGSPFTKLAIPTAQQPPLYPLFLAGIFKLFGAFSKTSLYAILVANALAGGLIAFFVYRVGLQYRSPAVALIAAWAWAIFPPIVITDVMLSSYAFAALAVVLWLNFVPGLKRKISNWMLLGAAVGLTLLLNPMLVLLLPASALWLNKKQAVVMTAAALVAVSPWYVRNYRVMGHFYPALRDNLGMELYLGNHPGMSGTCDYWTGQSPYGSELPRMGEAPFFEARGKDALAYIRLEPGAFILRSLKRFAQFWFAPWPYAYVILLALAIWGIGSAPRPLAVFTLILFVLYPLVFYVTQAAWPTAYRHVIEPMMLLMAPEPAMRWIRGERSSWTAERRARQVIREPISARETSDSTR